MALNSIGVFGGGVQESLEDLIVRKMKQAEQAAVIENMRAQRDLQARGQDVTMRGQDFDREATTARTGLDRDRLGLDTKKHGEDVRQFDAQAPNREANAGYLRAQTTETQRKPAAEQEARDFTTGRDKTQHGYRLGEIGASRAPRADDSGQYTSVQQVIGPDGKPALAIVDRRSGTATPVQMPAGFEPNRPARPVTGAERQTLAYYLRMEQALKDIEALEPEISKQGLAGQLQGQHAPNMLQSDTQQRYRQAQRAFTEGRLRKESGAAIPEGEYENDARTYFFQPGDKSIDQKRAGRRQVLDGLKMSSGRAYQEHFGDDGDKPKGDDTARRAAELLKKYGGG
jgi:hypothetical protein